MAISVTESELLDALASAQRASPDGQTAGEMAEATGISHKKVLTALKAMQSVGRLQVRFGSRVGIDGRQKPVPLYTILPKKRR